MNVLLLMAHADDESLGAGGTIQRLLATGHEVQLLIMSNGLVKRNGLVHDNRAALARACTLLGLSSYAFLELEDQRFEQYPLSELADKVNHVLVDQPELIITHAPSDLNQDHRIAYEVACIIGRPRDQAVGLIACEIPCVTTWHGYVFQPHLYVDITVELDVKVMAFGCYENETKRFPDPYSAEGLRTLAHMRGMESGYAAAEAFQIIRWYPHLAF